MCGIVFLNDLYRQAFWGFWLCLVFAEEQDPAARMCLDGPLPRGDTFGHRCGAKIKGRHRPLYARAARRLAEVGSPEEGQGGPAS